MKKYIAGILISLTIVTAALATGFRYDVVSNSAGKFFTGLGFDRVIHLGYLSRMSFINKFGYNLTVSNTGEHTIRSQGGLYSVPSAAETMSVVSSSANDTAGGTGAREIRIICVNEDYDEVVITMIPNGTTPVVTTETCFAINKVEVIEAGSGKTNAGDFVLTQTTSGLSLRAMPAGDSVSQSCTYMVPRNFSAFVEEVEFSSIKQGSGAPEVIIFSNLQDSTSGVIKRIFRASFDTLAEGTVRAPNPFGSPLPEKSAIWFNASSDVNNTQVACRIKVLLISNI